MSQVLDPSPDLPAVPSPYEGKIISAWEHLKLSFFWFGTNFLWGALLTIMLPQEIERLAPATKAQTLGIITGMAAFVALFVPLIIGPISDRCASRWGRRRPFIGVGVLINLLGLAVMTLGFGNRDLYLYFVSFMIVQLGNNVATAAFMGVIPDMVPAEQRGKASGFMAIMTQLGTLAGVIVTGRIFSLDKTVSHLVATQTSTIRYMILALVLLIAGILSLTGIKEVPLPERPPKLHLGSYFKGLWISPKEFPDFAWVWITRFLVMLGFYSFLPFLQYYLHDMIGVQNPGSEATKLIALILIGASISGLAGGAISDRIGRKRVVYIANTTMGIMSFGLVFCRTIPQVLIVGMLFGIGYGAYVSVDWALGTDVLPSRKDAGKDMAVWHIAMTLPQSLAAPMAGTLIASFGMRKIMLEGEPFYEYTNNGYTAMLIMCATFVLLGALLLKNVRSPR